jgi:uncharacterized metal-binding protein
MMDRDAKNMPNAQTHDAITLVTGVSGTAVAWNLGLSDFDVVNASVLLGSYVVSGFLFSPDLDLHSRPYTRWRWLRWIWRPYRRLAGHHRSWISHSLIWGPLIRILYFVSVMILLSLGVLFLLSLLIPVDPTGSVKQVITEILNWISLNPVIVGYALAGFFLGSASHVIADIIVTRFKRTF